MYYISRMYTSGGFSMHIKNWKKEVLTIPNILSLFRLVLIPVYVVIYLNARVDNDYYLAAGILAALLVSGILVSHSISTHAEML